LRLRFLSLELGADLSEKTRCAVRIHRRRQGAATRPTLAVAARRSGSRYPPLPALANVGRVALAVTWSDFGRDLGGQDRYAAGDALSEQRTEERA